MAFNVGETIVATIALEVAKFIEDAERAKQAADNLDDAGKDAFSGAEKSADSFSKKLGDLGDRVTSFGKKWSLMVTAPIAGFLGISYQQAASLEQAIGKTEAVYGDASQSIIEWSENSARSYGMSQTAALDMVGTYGQIMQAQGMATEQSQEYSQELIGLAADMSAFSDRDISQSSNAIRAALTGEYESLKSFGIVLKAAEVDQEALNIARAQGTEEVTEAHRVQARYNIIMRQTTQMHGQFAREADGASGQLAIFKANMADLAANLGNVLLPVGTKVTAFLNTMLTGFMALPQPVKTVAVVLLAVLAAVGPLAIGIGTMMSGLAALPAVAGAVSTAFGVMGTAMMAVFANPLMLAGIAVVAAGIAAYKTNFLGFADLVNGSLGALQDFWGYTQLIFGQEHSTTGTLTTTFDGDSHTIQWMEEPDGTIKYAVMSVAEDGTLTEIGEVIESYTDPENPNIAHIKIQPEGDGEAFWTTVDLTTGKIESVDIEVKATGAEDAAGAIEKAWGWAVLLSKIDPWERLQGASDSAMQWMNRMGNKMEGLISDAASFTWDAIQNTTAFQWAEEKLNNLMTLIGFVQLAWDLLFGGREGADMEQVDAEKQQKNPTAYTAEQRENRLGATFPSGLTGADIVDNAKWQASVGIFNALQQAIDPVTTSLGEVSAAALATNPSFQSLQAVMGTSASTATGFSGTMGTTASTTEGAGVRMGTAFQGIASGAALRFAEARNAATSQFGSMETEVTGHMGAMGSSVSRESEAMQANASRSAATMQGSVVGQVVAMAAATAIQMGLMVTAGTNAGEQMSTGLVGALMGAAAQVAVQILLIVASVQSAGSSGYAAGHYAGSMISRGFADGMLAYLGVIQGAASAMVAAASSAVIAKAMISSPSKLFRRHGGDSGEGYGLGFLDKIPMVKRAASKLVEAAIPTRAPRYAGVPIDTPIMGANSMRGSVTIINNYDNSDHSINTTASAEELGMISKRAQRGDAAATRMSSRRSVKQYGRLS